ncbi:HNH endonuclease [Vibrio cyclitrophicus]|uniref:HNH endonuclease n=1 Tax=Vibrio cyclitrophicus TaxID=47951 RepID=UPI0018E4B304|nr:HNH endonuclease [Vibrio cyclitrophicus]
MLLHALSEYKQGHQRLFRFEDEVDQQVKDLLVQYGPTRKAYHPEYPFWRLADEKASFWELKNGEECIPCKSNTDPKKSELIKYNVMAGFDAAHIKWKQYSGSCEVSNGIALCSIHHKALDRGVITFDNELKVQVSPAVTGGDMVERLIWGFENKQISLPRDASL